MQNDLIVVDTNPWQILPSIGSCYQVGKDLVRCVMAFPNGLILAETVDPWEKEQQGCFTGRPRLHSGSTGKPTHHTHKPKEG